MAENKSYHHYPPLTPVVSNWMTEIFQKSSFLHQLMDKYGSPINLLHTKPFENNFTAYGRVFDKYDLNHQIFFARKANTCKIFAKEADAFGYGVDVASYNELKECLNVGCDPSRLVVTAAIKTESLVELALENDVLLIIDNEEECNLINRMASELQKKAIVGIRISGFTFEGEKLYSRFGFDIDTVKDFIISAFSEESEFDSLIFKGSQFHLDGYSIGERTAALFQLIKLSDNLEKHQISISFIDIGGGLLTNYLASKSQWEAFWKELKQALLDKRDPITFRNNGLGYSFDNGRIQNSPNVYPYYNEIPKEKFLDAVLSGSNDNGKTVASLLRERNIELRIEPGRSLLDQCGLTIARVVHRKQDQNNDWLVGLEMNRSQLYSSSADFLVDPVYIPAGEPENINKPESVYLTGGYCLEQDLILKRKITLPRLPEIGDFICFVNTAGYMMHFYETRSHLYDFSANLVMQDDSDEVIPDEEIT